MILFHSPPSRVALDQDFPRGVSGCLSYRRATAKAGTYIPQTEASPQRRGMKTVPLMLSVCVCIHVKVQRRKEYVSENHFLPFLPIGTSFLVFQGRKCPLIMDFILSSYRYPLSLSDLLSNYCVFFFIIKVYPCGYSIDSISIFL